MYRDRDWDILEAWCAEMESKDLAILHMFVSASSVRFGLVWFGRFLGVINSCLSVRSTSVAVSCVFFYVQLGLTNSHPCSRNAFVFDVNSSIFFFVTASIVEINEFVCRTFGVSVAGRKFIGRAETILISPNAVN